MYLKLTDQQLKMITCMHVCVYVYIPNIYTYTCIKLMLTTDLKSRIHTHTKKKKKRKKKERERILKIVIKSQGKRTKELSKQPKAINKIAMTTYLSTITLNVNRLKAPIIRNISNCQRCFDPDI